MVVNGLLIGGVYGVAALGLGLVWGVMSVVNVAHGDFLIFLAYMTWILVAAQHLSPFVALLLLIPAGFLAGMVLYRLLVRHLVGRTEVELMSLVLFFGLSAIVYGFSAYQWGADFRSLPIPLPTFRVMGLVVPGTRLAAFLIGTGLMLWLRWFFRRTYWARPSGRWPRVVTPPELWASTPTRSRGWPSASHSPMPGWPGRSSP